MDPIGNDPIHLNAELDIRIQLWEDARVARRLDPGLARLKTGPIPPEFPTAPKTHRDLTELGLEQGGSFLLAGISRGKKGIRAYRLLENGGRWQATPRQPQRIEESWEFPKVDGERERHHLKTQANRGSARIRPSPGHLLGPLIMGGDLASQGRATGNREPRSHPPLRFCGQNSQALGQSTAEKHQEAKGNHDKSHEGTGGPPSGYSSGLREMRTPDKLLQVLPLISAPDPEGPDRTLMAILTRYLIRSHLGPFLFSFLLITSLLFINTIAIRLKDLVGKGLPWSVLLQVAGLALPHTVALTFPMAVLVAVLFAYSELTAENEITAMTAGGINPVRLLLPLVGIGIILAQLMFLFDDRVLPEANHSLRKLLVDVTNKSPTLQLREHVVNEIRASTTGSQPTYYLQAVRIDPVTSFMQDIVIYDVSDPQARRTTYADSGTMAFNENQTDLFLTLYDGELREVPNRDADSFQRAFFEKQFYPIRGINDLFERGGATDFRSDREMSTDMLADSVQGAREAREEYLAITKEEALFAVRRALGWQLAGDSLAPPDAAAASARPEPNAPRRPGELLPRDDVTAAVHQSSRANALAARTLLQSAIEKRVEIHKKYAIAFTCIVFVLIGAPLAIRFPRGGVGMVITASVAVFALFWISLIAGEALADRGHVGPAIAMWGPNLILLPLGLYMVRGMSRQVATARGGGWDDLFFTMANGIRKPFRNLARRRRG